MTSTTTELTVPGMSAKDAERHQRARRAYSEARRLARGWETTARMLARDSKLKLELTWDRSETNGKVIRIKVPMELGNRLEHKNGLCGKRGSDFVLICEKCAVLEDVNITIIHEVAHIIMGTFETIKEADRRDLVKRALDLECEGKAETSRAKRIVKRIETAPPHIQQDYLNLANLVSPFMPLIINACEDIRVNAMMQQDRPGTRPMFKAQTNRVFDQGIYQADGSYSRWIDAPPNAQALIGVYCMTWDMSLKGRIDPEIAEKLEGDEELLDLVAKMKATTSVRQVYNLAFFVLDTLRRLGFMRSPDDPEDEQPEQEQGDPGEGASGGESIEPQDSEESDSGSSEPMESGSSSSGSGSRASASSKPEASEPDNSSSDEEPDDSSSKVSEDTQPEEGDGQSDDLDDEERDSDEGDLDSDDNQESGGEPQDDADGQETSSGAPDSGGDDSGEQSIGDDIGDANSAGKGTGEPVVVLVYTQADMEKDGLPEEVQRLFDIFGRHEPDKKETPEDRKDKQALKIAIVQLDHFDRPSLKIDGVRIYRYKPDNLEGAWEEDHWYDERSSTEIKVPERILTPALQRLRIAFTDNARKGVERNLRSGKVHTRTLARRVPVGDDRLFYKVRAPGKKDYAVLVGIDCSGSTAYHIEPTGVRLDLIKAAAYTKAELLHRLGIEFAVYAHSGDFCQVEIMVIKEFKEPWGEKQRKALKALHPYNANLDGHTLEFYRKAIEKRPEHTKLLLYYTDGAMPAENYNEELAILQDEIRICQKLGIQLVGIGVQTDSPKQHGLDTILLNEISDISHVINELRKRLQYA